MWVWVTDESHHLRSRWKLLRLTICACRATSFTSLNPPQYFMPGATICRRVLPQLCVSLGIGSAHQKTWHRNNSRRLFHFTFTLFKCLPALSHIEVSPSVTSVAQRWHKCGRRWGWGKPIIHVPLLVGWQSCMPAAMLTCTVVAWHNFPLIWQRSWAPPACPSCQPPIRLHFRSILIVHGLHSKSSSFTDKEAVSTRKVKLWWK